MYIYTTKNLITNDVYVGQSNRSIGESREYLGSGRRIKKAIKRYGKKNFIKTILESGIKSQKELNEKEKYWIKKLNPTYNILRGGRGLTTEEAIELNETKSAFSDIANAPSVDMAKVWSNEDKQLA